MPGNGCDRCALNIVKNRFRSGSLATCYDDVRVLTHKTDIIGELCLGGDEAVSKTLNR